MSTHPRAPAPARRRLAAIVTAVVLLTGGAAVVAAGSISSSATVERTAERIPQVRGDVAVAFDQGDVERVTVESALETARRAGGVGAAGRSGSLGMRRITRAGALVHGPPAGWLIPTVYTALPRGALGGMYGGDVTAVLTDDRSVVMNEMTAGLTGARVGDVIEMQAANGATVPLRVAGIRPYDQIGAAELVFDLDVAVRLGATADTRVVMWGIQDRAAFDRAVADTGLGALPATKVARGWDPPDPDSTLSTIRAKVALGEPWYRFGSDGSVEMHPTWLATNLTDGRILLDDEIRVYARCHRRVVADLAAALDAVAAAGLAHAIDVANANTDGGCYVPRFSRQGGQIGFLSRHTYGMAFDTNTLANCFGCRPQMNCDVVRIFRRHGFAWGGNFRSPDGMHFEWVGEPLDQLPFPSRYCPNAADTLTEAVSPFGAGTPPDEPLGVDVVLTGLEVVAHEHEHDESDGA